MDDTYSGTYTISTAAQLRALASAVTNDGETLSGVTIRLTQDIDLNPGITFEPDGTYTADSTPEQWTPIGYCNDTDVIGCTNYASVSGESGGLDLVANGTPKVTTLYIAVGGTIMWGSLSLRRKWSQAPR